jgi:hypothetical protein
MQAGPRAIGRAAQAARAGEPDEGLWDAPHGQWRAPCREQAPRGGRPRPQLVTAARLRVQDIPRRRGQRHPPRLANRGLTHRAAPVGALHIRTVQRPRRTPPHPRHGQYAQERGGGVRAEAGHRGAWACGCAEWRDLLLPRNGGGLTPIAGREPPMWRHRGPGVERAAVRGQAAYHPSSCGPMGGLDALRLGRPAQGEVRGETDGTLPFGTVDALPQGDPGGLQLTPQRTPDIAGRRAGVASWTHPAPPGQGWARAPQAP